MTGFDPLQLAAAVRNACVLAALDGYQRAQIAGLCQEGTWECAVDAMRVVDLTAILQDLAAADVLQQQHDRRTDAALAVLRRDASDCPKPSRANCRR